MTPQHYGIEATKAGIDAIASIGKAFSDNRSPIDFLFDLPTVIEEVGNVAPKFQTIILEASEYSTEELAELGDYARTHIPGIFLPMNAPRTPQKYGIEATKAGIDAVQNLGSALLDNRSPIDFLFDVPAVIANVSTIAPKFEVIGLEASEYSPEELAQLGAYTLAKIPGIFIRK